MSENKPSPVTFHEYDIPTLNTVFAWSAASLFLVSVWMIYADYHREWKQYQSRFNEYEIARTKQAIAAADAAVDPKALAAVQARLEAATAQVQSKQGEIDKLASELEGLAGKWYIADQAYKFVKADLDVARYEVDEARHKPTEYDVKAKETAFAAILAKTEERRLAYESVNSEKMRIEAALAELRRDQTGAEKELTALHRERSRLQKVLEKIDHSLVKDYFRDRPLVDFLAPTIKVSQVVLPKIHEQVNFLTVPRVDRCQSCHLAIDKPGWTGEDVPPEFRTHSRLNLLIGEKHAPESLGCTGCHAGSGRALTFTAVNHTPQSGEQAAAWKAKYDWHEEHYWDFPMLPLQYTEANCVNCHNQESRVPGADKLNAGRQLLEESGCFGCHKIDRPGYADLRKVGPELAHLKGKVDKVWLYKWLQKPKSFRPSTRMPKIWDNSNTDHAVPGMDFPLRNTVEIEAVSRYLLARGTDYANLVEPKSGGDPVRGKWVVENRGCLACHIVSPGDTGEGRAGASFGPDLGQVGSKLGAKWLYNWIRDPKALWPDTKMPDLRLSDDEVADATAYLLTLKNPEFEQKPLPDLSTADAQKMLSDVTYEYLRKEMTTAAASERRDQMTEDERYDYLGKKVIGRQGCFGCHPGLPGYEDAQPIGTELTTWASKLITQLDFGLEHLPHTKHDWLRAKLTNPRVFDNGKIESKEPQDLLRMPNFEYSPEQVEKLMTVVLGFQNDLTQAGGRPSLDTAALAIENARRVMRSYNCQGCHVIEGEGGGMQKVLAGGLPFSPPVLHDDYKLNDGRVGQTRQGAKTQPDWFFEFLKAPTTVRPWLNVRMPSFAMSDDRAGALVSYFSGLASAPFPYQYHDRGQIDPKLVAEGKQLFEKFQCINCHLPMEEAAKKGIKPEELAPNLDLTKTRLAHEWIGRWLKDPSVIQEGTRMPSFFFLYDEDEKSYMELMPNAQKSIDALVAYLQYHGEAMPVPRVAAR